jgi:hypothetical protein
MSALLLLLPNDAAPLAAAAAADRLALTAGEVAACLRGHAREDDGAAFALLGAIGLPPHQIAAILPHARALARARQPGA